MKNNRYFRVLTISAFLNWPPVPPGPPFPVTKCRLSFGHSKRGMTHACWQLGFRPVDGPVAAPCLPSLCAALQRQSQRQEFLLSGSVSRYGFRTADFSRELARRRGMFECRSKQALPHGDSQFSITQYSVRCERIPRLAHLCRFRSSLDWYRTPSLPRRRFWSTAERNSLCAGLYDDRSVFGAISMGQVPSAQGSRQTPYPAGSAREHSFLYPHYGWKGSRYQRSRCANSRTGFLLCDGSWLSRLCTLVRPDSKSSLLRCSQQRESPVPAPLLTPHRQVHRVALRSDDCCDRTLNISALPGETAPGRICRCDDPEALFLPDQQLCTSSTDNYSALQMQMASGTVLQVDKTAPAHQSLLRNHGECRQDSSLDRNLRLRVGGDSQKAAQFGPQPLHNSTDFEPHAFLESPNFTSTYRIHEYESGAR